MEGLCIVIVADHSKITLIQPQLEKQQKTTYADNLNTFSFKAID